MSDEICIEPEEVTARWLTEEFEAAGLARGASVTDVEFTEYVGTGQMSRNARFRLIWSEGDDRPQTMVAKFPSSEEQTRATAFQTGAYFNEHTFYTEIVPTVKIQTPTCWVSKFDPEAQRCVLLMEDLADAEAGDQFTDCTPARAALVIDQAVGLHYPRWDDPTLDDLPFGNREDAKATAGLFYAAALDVSLGRVGDRLSDDVVDLAKAFGGVVGDWAQGIDAPRTVVHGDFRPDNFLFTPSGTTEHLHVVDWQTATVGHAASDVAYFIGGAYLREQRREIEKDMLETYRSGLAAAGVAYGAEDCWTAYRWGTLHGVLISVFALMMADQTERGDELLSMMLTRHAEHAIDLNGLELVNG